MLTSKHAQTEIFGLVIIVMLLTVFFLFGVHQMMKTDYTDIKTSYTQKEVAQYFVSSIISTTVPQCGGYELRELIKDCGSSYNNIFCEYGLNSCRVSQEVIDYYLNQTLIRWKRHYKLNISTSTGKTIYYNDSKFYNDIYSNNRNYCLEKKQGRAFIPLSPGTISIVLDMCI